MQTFLMFDRKRCPTGIHLRPEPEGLPNEEKPLTQPLLARLREVDETMLLVIEVGGSAFTKQLTEALASLDDRICSVNVILRGDVNPESLKPVLAFLTRNRLVDVRLTLLDSTAWPCQLEANELVVELKPSVTLTQALGSQHRDYLKKLSRSSPKPLPDQTNDQTNDGTILVLIGTVMILLLLMLCVCLNSLIETRV